MDGHLRSVSQPSDFYGSRYIALKSFGFKSPPDAKGVDGLLCFIFGGSRVSVDLKINGRSDVFLLLEKASLFSELSGCIPGTGTPPGPDTVPA